MASLAPRSSSRPARVPEPVVMPPYALRRLLAQIFSPTLLSVLPYLLPRVPRSVKVTVALLLLANIKSFPLGTWADGDGDQPLPLNRRCGLLGSCSLCSSPVPFFVAPIHQYGTRASFGPQSQRAHAHARACTRSCLGSPLVGPRRRSAHRISASMRSRWEGISLRTRLSALSAPGSMIASELRSEVRGRC